MNWRHIAEGFASPFIATHEWVLKRYQTVANWAFTNWDVSPWWIAAQLFPAAMGLRIAEFGVAYSSDYPANTAGSPAWTVLLLMCQLKWWYDAFRAHKSWVKTPTALPRLTPVWSGISFMYLFLALAMTISLVMIWARPAENESFRAYWVFGYLGMLTVASGFYFCACSAPTLQKRKESRMLIPSEA